MTPERWQRIVELTQAASEEEADCREDFLQNACGDDDSLYQGVESLLAADEQAQSFIEKPAVRTAAAVLQEQPFQSGPTIVLKPNTTLQSRYVILRPIGAGGMGAVYEAKDNHLKNRVAIKQCFFSDARLRRAFEREAQLLASLIHPALPKVIDHFTEGDGQFLVMEFVPGQDLAESLRQRKQGFPQKEVLQWADQILDALAYLHGLDQPILHRDVKPSNLKLTDMGQIILLDFGLAKGARAQLSVVTTTGSIFGYTPGYAPLEQIKGTGTDPRSDLYSLAATLYELLTARRAEDALTRIIDIAEGNPDPLKPATALNPRVSPAVSGLLTEAMAVNRNQRPPSAVEMRRRLRRALSSSDASELPNETRASLGSLRSEPVSNHATHNNAIPARASGAIAVAGMIDGVGEASIAILPFQVPNSAPGEEYLGLGIADALITRFSRLRQVIVRPTSAVAKYFGADQGSTVAGRELGVDAVLEGSVRRMGSSWRITVQLVSVGQGSTLWADQFDNEGLDLFAVEDTISERVAVALIPTLSGDERNLLAKRYSQSAESYLSYIKGRYFWSNRTGSDFLKAIECFNYAIALDPQFALAYCGLADCYSLLSAFAVSATNESYVKAEAAARSALEIDDSLGEAHTSLGYVQAAYHKDFVGAEQEFRTALKIKPNYALAHQWYSQLLQGLTRFDEAIIEIKRAFSVDPSSLMINSVIGNTYFYMRQHEKAIRHYCSVLEIDPHHWYARYSLGWTYEQTGHYQKAESELTKARELFPANTSTLAALGHLYALSGETNRALGILKELEAPSDQRNVPPVDLATVHAGLNNKDQAFEQLERSYAEGSIWLLWLRVDPRWSPLHGDPRFADLLRRLKHKPLED